MNKYFISIGVVWVVLSFIIGLVIVLSPQPETRATVSHAVTYAPAEPEAEPAQAQEKPDVVVSKVRIGNSGLTDEQAEKSEFVRTSVKVSK